VALATGMASSGRAKVVGGGGLFNKRRDDYLRRHWVRRYWFTVLDDEGAAVLAVRLP